MTKILSCSFKNWFGPFNMLIVNKPSDTWLSRHFSNRAFAAYSLTKKSPLRLILFLKVFTIWCSFQKRRKKSRKYCSISRKLILNCMRKTVAFTKTEHLWSGVNTLTKSLKFQILLRQSFWSWFSPRVIKKYNKCFRPFKMLTVHESSDTKLFRHLSNGAFCNR